MFIYNNLINYSLCKKNLVPKVLIKTIIKSKINFTAATISETKTTSKRHHAPQYLERRKDRRRASEGTLQTRLKLRRSSRARKDKEEVCSYIHLFLK